MDENVVKRSSKPETVESRVDELLGQMTLGEKIGQMCQLNVGDSYIHDYLADAVRCGRVGSVLNVVDVGVVNELQRLAMEESRLGIPLLVGRDVIHGFKTVMPIPLGQAATWNPDVVREGARVAASEASSAGVNWTFAPMIDISRDARWGRIAESLGEDPHLASALGVAMIEGFQGNDLAEVGTIAACAKHFAGYGESESGRDYATTNIPENELRNVHLRPFRAAVEAGVTTLMTSFGDLDGVPTTANEFLLRQILREEWEFDGFVVSDWDSIRQLQIHGLTSSDRESAFEAAIAGVDMEMHGDAYVNHLEALIDQGKIGMELVDEAVANILRVKIRLGLFEQPYADPGTLPPCGAEHALATARRAAKQSIVMLTNEHGVLPLDAGALNSIALIGPLADDGYEQLGTWIFDGDAKLSVTALQAIEQLVGCELDIHHMRAMDTPRSHNTEEFDAAVSLAASVDVAILFLGEDSILSGEAHCRADIGLPGAQEQLVRRIGATGKPVVAVIQAGRPLTLTNIVDQVDAIFFAWHPGTMGGPAIADLLFGVGSPSGKLPATFPRMVGQIPIYYNQKNTGKPPTPESIVHIDNIDPHAQQLSLGMTAFHLDAGYTPLFPFGHGLSYASFDYDHLRLSASEISLGESLVVSVDLLNSSVIAAHEVVQLYVRDLVGSVTRPVRELKGFRRVYLEPEERITVEFELHSDDLAFHGRDMKLRAEPGEFHLWVGGSSDTNLMAGFRIVAGTSE